MAILCRPPSVFALSSLWLASLLCLSNTVLVQSFAIVRQPAVHHRSSNTHVVSSRLVSSSPSPSSSFLSMSTSAEMRRGVEIPLLDLTDSQDNYNEHMQPLPSAHLPDELTTVHVYGMQLTRPVHQMVVEETVNRGENVIGVGTAAERAFGHVAYKPLKDSLVGAIGCAAQILMVAPTSPEETASLEEGETAPMTVLCRGSYRFIVREVIKTIPFPVAIVDELIDDEPTIGPTSTETDDDVDDEDEDDEEDEDDMYADLTPSELVQRTLMAMKTHVDQQVNILERDMTPLEQSIVQDSSTDLDMNAQRQAAEETSAVFSTFAASLPDIAPTPGQIYFTVAMMAAELTNLNNNARRAFLRTTNGVERLRLVLGVMEEMVGMSRARKMASEITEETDEDSKDLKVGEPVLPPWAKSIRKGARLEYYWNEEWGWSEGEVVEEPVMVVNELLLTVQFDQDEDGTVQRLPFTPDDKVRWRPPQRKD